MFFNSRSMFLFFGYIGIFVLAAAFIVADKRNSRAEPGRDVTFLDQGWSQELREAYYFTPQGSRMMPYDWFMALERADGEGLFAETAHLQRYGFIPADAPTPLNPDGLPIGFAIDPDDGSVGLTCAACHTAEVTVDGTVVRIDGGAAALDFDLFYADLAAAVARTRYDPDRFAAFAGRILDPPSEEAVAALADAFAAFEARLAGDAAIRRPVVRSGFGRVDALTEIVNALAVSGQGDPRNLRSVGAPTSYPSLWLSSDLEFVQWFPVAASPIGRNVGEVLGVFGETTLTGPPEDWFTASVRLHDLHALESWVADLAPPVWDEAVMGPIDRDLAAAGEALYDAHCAACHNNARPPYRMTDPAVNAREMTFIEIGRTDYRAVGTDPRYMEALLFRTVRTNAATALANEGAALVPAPRYFLNTVGAVVKRAMADLDLSPEEQVAMHGYRFSPPAEPGGVPELYRPQEGAYLKAGPLAGIWATGPYLHNGSVATIYELLSPEAERRAVFWTGGQELDRERLGFVSLDAPGRFRFDTSVSGNRNIGHLYPRDGLSHDERLAIIEFLKTI